MNVVAVGNTVLFLDFKDGGWVEVSRVDTKLNPKVANEIASLLHLEFNPQETSRYKMPKSWETVQSARDERQHVTDSLDSGKVLPRAIIETDKALKHEDILALKKMLDDTLTNHVDIVGILGGGAKLVMIDDSVSVPVLGDSKKMQRSIREHAGFVQREDNAFQRYMLMWGKKIEDATFKDIEKWKASKEYQDFLAGEEDNS